MHDRLINGIRCSLYTYQYILGIDISQLYDFTYHCRCFVTSARFLDEDFYLYRLIGSMNEKRFYTFLKPAVVVFPKSVRLKGDFFLDRTSSMKEALQVCYNEIADVLKLPEAAFSWIYTFDISILFFSPSQSPITSKRKYKRIFHGRTFKVGKSQESELTFPLIMNNILQHRQNWVAIFSTVLVTKGHISTTC